jgi:hypothetical protein
MRRDSYNLDPSTWRQEDHTPPTQDIDWDARSPEVPPELLQLRRYLNTWRSPVDVEHELRMQRKFILQLAEVIYSREGK